MSAVPKDIKPERAIARIGLAPPRYVLLEVKSKSSTASAKHFGDVRDRSPAMARGRKGTGVEPRENDYRIPLYLAREALRRARGIEALGRPIGST
jgi:hypothetical protein